MATCKTKIEVQFGHEGEFCLSEGKPKKGRKMEGKAKEREQRKKRVKEEDRTEVIGLFQTSVFCCRNRAEQRYHEGEKEEETARGKRKGKRW